MIFSKDSVGPTVGNNFLTCHECLLVTALNLRGPVLSLLSVTPFSSSDSGHKMAKSNMVCGTCSQEFVKPVLKK